jgi:glutamate synthase (NADPH/NADH) large chain
MLLNVIKTFQLETQSLVAKDILDNWSTQKQRISLIMPRDYARVLEVMAKATREGMPVEGAVMAAING